jgi:hypothetical protein
METRVRIFLLTVVLATLPGCATVRHWFHGDQAPAPQVEEDTAPPRVIEPEVARRKITVQDPQPNVELGLYYGVLSIEDRYPPRLASRPRTTSPRTSSSRANRALACRAHEFRELNGGVQLIPDSERRFVLRFVSRLQLPAGRGLYRSRPRLTSAFYLLGGIGTDFAGTQSR